MEIKQYNYFNTNITDPDSSTSSRCYWRNVFSLDGEDIKITLIDSGGCLAEQEFTKQEVLQNITS